jgi:iron complex outermembrane receptor protein
MIQFSPVKSPLSLALLLAINTLPAIAADSTATEPTTQLQRVEVTGTAIRRVDAETAVPVTILRVEELREQGVTTTEELVSRISANQSWLVPGVRWGRAVAGRLMRICAASALTKPWCCSMAGV